MNWALPVGVNKNNYEYAKKCLRYAKMSIVCGHTMKVKNIDHRQYCKYYKKEDDRFLQGKEKVHIKDIELLEKLIHEYEKENCLE